MASIFLSYARADAGKAERIAQALAAGGHSVWWDRRLNAGVRFTAEIDAQLQNADLVVVLWSSRSVESSWVQDEAGVGRDSNRLVPVQLEPVLPPLGFRQYHALDLSRWNGRGKDARAKLLLKAVEEKLSGVDSPSNLRHSARPATRSRWAATAALLLAVVVAAAIFVLRPGGAQAEPASLAVLPFKNLAAGDPYFAEGVAEEILNQLAREPQFKVAGRTSAALFKDAADLREVGRRLRVAHVLEGSVRSSGNQVRVDVSLVETGNGKRIWSQNFRGNLDDIFAIQESIGTQVAANLKRRLVRTAALRGSRTTRGDVYQLYLTARSLIRSREPAKLATAVELLQQAVRIDPNFAPAWARLAQARLMKRAYGPGGILFGTRTRPDELAAAQRAIALAPDLAEARAVMWLLLDGPHVSAAAKRRAGAEIERAVQLDPTDAQNWYWLFLKRQRDDLDFEHALAAGKKAAEIDPFFVFNQFYMEVAWAMGERDAAARLLRHWAQNHPEPDKRESALESIAMFRNDWSEVYRHLKKEHELAPADVRLVHEQAMGLVLRRLGLVDEARRYLAPDFIGMWLGKPPAQDELTQGDPMEFWVGASVPLVARVLINNGRAADLVSLYDRAFPSRDSMLGRLNKAQFVLLAPIAAAGLRDVGRTDEAARLVAAADRLCTSAIHKGRTPIDFQVDCSRNWAMLGRHEDAIRTLNRALKAGWRPNSGWSYGFVDEPAYRTIRDDPRLKRLGAFVLAENAREGRELLMAGV